MSAPWIVVIVLLSVAVTALAAAFLTLRRRIVDVLELPRIYDHPGYSQGTPLARSEQCGRAASR
jgi:hypothetical protein